MKKYFQAIKEYEKKQKLYQRLQKYLISGDAALIKQFREGVINLPSASLLKKLYQKYIHFCLLNRELDYLFLKIVTCAKSFYPKTIRLSKDTKIPREKFEQKFANSVQPLGQKMINYLLMIRLRIKLILKNNSALTNQTGLKKISTRVNSVTDQFIHQMDLAQLRNKHIIHYNYYGILILIIMIMVGCNYLSMKMLSQELRIVLNLLIFSLLAICSIAMYPTRKFGKIDISGKNITAHRYKLFFNNLTQYIFTQ